MLVSLNIPGAHAACFISPITDICLEAEVLHATSQAEEVAESVLKVLRDGDVNEEASKVRPLGNKVHQQRRFGVTHLHQSSPPSGMPLLEIDPIEVTT